MTQIATTIEQSKKLIELGLNVDTADMNYCNSSYKGKDYIGEWKLSLQSPKEAKDILDMSVTDWDTCWEIIPAWSLSALIELMPAYLITNGKRTTNIQMRKLDDGNIGFYYFINQETNIIKGGINSIDAAFEMMCYLLENKLIK